MIARLRDGLCERDRGITLVEMLVAMVLTGLVATLVTSMVITAERQSGATQVRLRQVDNDRVGMDAMLKTLRTAVEPAQLQLDCTDCGPPTSAAVAVAEPKLVKFYANLNSDDSDGPVLVTFEVDNSGSNPELQETLRQPDQNSAPFTYECDPGTPPCDVVTRPLVRDLASPVPRMFTYYDGSGSALVPPEGQSQLTPEQLSKVSSIDVSVAAHSANAYGVGATTVTSRVSLPNANTSVLPTPTPSSSGG